MRFIFDYGLVFREEIGEFKFSDLDKILYVQFKDLVIEAIKDPNRCIIKCKKMVDLWEKILISHGEHYEWMLNDTKIHYKKICRDKLSIYGCESFVRFEPIEVTLIEHYQKMLDWSKEQFELLGQYKLKILETPKKPFRPLLITSADRAALVSTEFASIADNIITRDSRTDDGSSYRLI